MYIEKEPEKTVKEQQAKKALEKEPVDPAKAKKKEELKATTGYVAQAKAVSARDQVPSPSSAPKKDPVAELKKLFREMDLPDKLVPENVINFTYDAGSGRLVIELKSAFSKQFDAENTVSFDKTISGTLERGRFTGIAGVRRGSASIIEIARLRPGIVGIRGKMGPFSKTLEFRDEQIPSLP